MLNHSQSTPASHGIDTNLQLKLLPASSRIEALLLWRQLENELSSQRLACSFVWTDTWLTHYGQLIPHQFAIGMRNGKACGIVLVTHGVGQHAGPFTLKTRHLGTAGEPDADSVCVEYNALLVGPEDRLEFCEALCRWVFEETSCDEFRIDGFDGASIEPFLTQHSRTHVERKTSYFFDLRESRLSGEEPLMRLGPHTRERIRRTRRELGVVSCEWAETAVRAEELFLKMVLLHQTRWNSVGMPGSYSSRRFHDFHLELLNRAVPLGMMTIVGLSSFDRLIGAAHVLIDNRRGLLYQCGWVPGEGRVSHGMALDYLCICECLKRGYDEVDFLAGNAIHKRRLATNKAELAWIVWRRSNVKNLVIDVLRKIKRTKRPVSDGESVPD